MLPNGESNPMEILMQVEVPVSVSLGRTKMRMKELLGLTQGSVVELDQHVGDEVEIRVNNCLIAHGEVVGVDGNYGVRILRMAGEGGAGALREIT
jgi:flagellar motor switch protein FliN